MAKSNYLTTIAIDFERSAFHFYSMIGNDRSTITHHIKNFSGGIMDTDFFPKFKQAVKEFAEETPSETIRKVTVVIPDKAVLSDAVKVPTMRGAGQTKKMLDVTLGSLYRNFNDLRVVSYVADQNKQYSTFAVSAVQKHIVTSIYSACSENKLLVDTLTTASNAAVSCAAMFNSKLKNASYLFLDIKDIYSVFVFVANGKPVGSYILPFGLEFLRKPAVTQEDMLFDHSFAELTVLNARERAKSKKLTIMAAGGDFDEELTYDFGVEAETADENGAPAADAAAADATADDATADAETAEEEAEESTEETTEETTEEAEEIEEAEEDSSPIAMPTVASRPLATPKIFTRKSPRKLPKFMQREIPEDAEGITAENFRVFVKWALTLIQGNEKLTELGKPGFVCVNLPDDLAFVLEKVNGESEENGLSFDRLPVGDHEPEVLSNLELYGGLFPKNIISACKF